MTYYSKYYEIINNRKINPLTEDIKGHYHHIKPRSIYPELEKDKDNIVKLTYKEHLLSHIYLYLYYKYELKDEIKSFKMGLAVSYMTKVIKIDLIKMVLENNDISQYLEDFSKITEESNKKLATSMKNLYITDDEYSKRVSDGEKQYYIEHPERKQQQSEKMKKYWRRCDIDQSQLMKDYFIDHPESANKHAEGMVEYYKDEEHIKETTRKSKEYYKSEEARQKSRDCMNGRMTSIYQLDLSGNIIREWKSVKIAADEFGIFASKIFECLNDESLTCVGFKWKRVNNIKRKVGKRVILQIDKDGNIIREYDSVKSAIKEFHISKRCIMKSLKHEQDFSRGYKWVYKDEYDQQVKTV